MTENTVAKRNVPQRADSQVPATRESELYMPCAVDIFERDDCLTVVADVPGVTRNDLDIDVEDRILTIRGQVSGPERTGRIAEEFGLRNYFRQFRLSEDVDRDKITAALDQGVLTLTLPMAESVKPRRIDVKVS